MLLVGNQKSYIVLFFFRHILNILDSIKHFEYNMEIKLIKILQLQNKKLHNQNCKCLLSLTIFKLKNGLFGAANVADNSDKAKWVCSSDGIASDGASL